MRTSSLAIVLFLSSGTALAQGRPGSIYDPERGPQLMMADKTARIAGDLITIIIEESQDVDNQETSTLSKQTNLEYAIENFDLRPEFFSTLPALEASSQDDFNGTANYKKKGTFQARITALVMDVLPNGNLVVQGRREIRIDNETKVIEFSGVVRRFDIKTDNTIQSELVADARVAYSGEGTLTNSTNRTGIGSAIHDFIAWIWPF